MIAELSSVEAGLAAMLGYWVAVRLAPEPQSEDSLLEVERVCRGQACREGYAETVAIHFGGSLTDPM